MWCWNLGCTTCGCVPFRRAFLKIAEGDFPDSPTWGDLPESDPGNWWGKRGIELLDEQQITRLISTCSDANLSVIAHSAKFPDWLVSVHYNRSHVTQSRAAVGTWAFSGPNAFCGRAHA